MKASFVGLALAGMLASAAAMPTNDKHYEEDKKHYEHKDDGKHDSLDSFPFHFTSTFHAKATPDTMYVCSFLPVTVLPSATPCG